MKMERNHRCWCGSGKKYKQCHATIDTKAAALQAAGYVMPSRKLLKSKVQIDGIRESGKVNVAVLDYIGEYIHAGVCTEELDQLIHHKTTELGGIPAPLNYNGYPKSTCISIDNVVCHGIPSKDVCLKDGDVVNIDVSTIYNGYFSDSSRMFLIGEVSEEKKRLVQIAKECMELGKKQVKPWGFLGDIGQAINDHARQNQYAVVNEIGGHGIGLQFHEEPWVSHVSKAGTGMRLVPGLIFTIEPMVNMGSAEVAYVMGDEWTVYTLDGKPSAQWESMVLVTESGYEVLAY